MDKGLSLITVGYDDDLMRTVTTDLESINIPIASTSVLGIESTNEEIRESVIRMIADTDSIGYAIMGNLENLDMTAIRNTHDVGMETIPDISSFLHGTTTMTPWLHGGLAEHIITSGLSKHGVILTGGIPDANITCEILKAHGVHAIMMESDNPIMDHPDTMDMSVIRIPRGNPLSSMIINRNGSESGMDRRDIIMRASRTLMANARMISSVI